MNILVSMHKNLRDTFFDNAQYAALEQLGTISYNDTNENFSCDELKQRLENTDIIITGWGNQKITPEIAGKRLKLVAHTGGSVGPIIDTSIYDLGIRVVSGNEMFAKSVAEGVLAYILCELRHLNYYSFETKNGNWIANSDLKTLSLHGQTVGIVSLGKISKYLLTLLKPFDVKVKVYSTHQSDKAKEEYGFEYASLEDIFSTCDIISVHTAANRSTSSMINERLFDMIKQGGIFINTSRGSVIDEDALINSLKGGRFSAVLDVYKNEPLEKESLLHNLPNVTLYPHMAGPSSDLRTYITQQIINDVENLINKKSLLYEIDKETASSMTQTG